MDFGIFNNAAVGGFVTYVVKDIITWWNNKVKPEALAITKELKTELDTEEAKARIAVAKYTAQAHVEMTKVENAVKEVVSEAKAVL